VSSAAYENAPGVSANGRRINLIALDDAYSPPKAVEQTRRLVEVAFIFGPQGTPTNSATAKYLTAREDSPSFYHHGVVEVREFQGVPIPPLTRE
jgi:branched-chain amino acid transport system substrate-binding protein